MSQKDLAAAVGVVPSYLSHVEADRREPSLTLLRALARELDVPLGQFLVAVLVADMSASDRELLLPLVSGLQGALARRASVRRVR